jgi:hypothetical protein
MMGSPRGVPPTIPQWEELLALVRASGETIDAKLKELHEVETRVNAALAEQTEREGALQQQAEVLSKRAINLESKEQEMRALIDADARAKSDALATREKSIAAREKALREHAAKIAALGEAV